MDAASSRTKEAVEVPANIVSAGWTPAAGGLIFACSYEVFQYINAGALYEDLLMWSGRARWPCGFASH